LSNVNDRLTVDGVDLAARLAVKCTCSLSTVSSISSRLYSRWVQIMPALRWLISVSAAAVASGRPVAVCNSTRSFDRLPRSQSVAEPGRGVARGCGGCGSTGRQLLGAANGRKLFFLIHVKIPIVISYVFACNRNKALQLQRRVFSFENKSVVPKYCCANC